MMIARVHLPTNLLLRCEGIVRWMSEFEGSRPDSNEGKFETMLRLKDGELSDTNAPWLTTKDCVLRNNVVRFAYRYRRFGIGYGRGARLVGEAGYRR